MYFKIEKSLENIKAVFTECFPDRGICIEFNNYKEKNPQFLIYKNGIKKDICINGWTFPYIYNNIEYKLIPWVGYCHVISFELLDPAGELQKVEYIKLFGNNQALTVESFYSLLYNISCCTDMKQFKLLYELIIDNDRFHSHGEQNKALEVLNFIEIFVPQLENIKETDYLIGLKRKINAKFKRAQEIIASADSPL